MGFDFGFADELAADGTRYGFVLVEFEHAFDA